MWALCYNKFLKGHSDAEVIFVNCFPSDLVEFLGSLGIQSRRARALIDDSPHCNKIIPFLEEADYEYVIVCDSDLYFVDELQPFLRSKNIRAAPNNHCNPPRHIYEILFANLGWKNRYRGGVSLLRNQTGSRETYYNNISAGIVALPRHIRCDFAQEWTKKAEWLVENSDLLDRWVVHIDQVSFALTCEELGLDVDFLPPQVNAVLGLLNAVEVPVAFHLTSAHIPLYRAAMRADGTFNPDAFRSVKRTQFVKLNNLILEARNVIAQLPSTREHQHTFLNPEWRRS